MKRWMPYADGMAEEPEGPYVLWVDAEARAERERRHAAWLEGRWRGWRSSLLARITGREIAAAQRAETAAAQVRELLEKLQMTGKSEDRLKEEIQLLIAPQPEREKVYRAREAALRQEVGRLEGILQLIAERGQGTWFGHTSECALRPQPEEGRKS